MSIGRLVWMVLFLNIFVNVDTHCAYAQSGERDRLYFVNSSNGQLIEVVNHGSPNKRMEPIEAMIGACRVAEKKYESIAEKIRQFRRSIQRKHQEQRELKERIALNFISTCRKRAKNQKPALVFEEYDPAKKFLNEATETQLQWISDGIRKLGIESRRKLEKEYFRFMILEAGLINVLSQTEFKNEVGIKSGQLAKLWQLHRESSPIVASATQQRGKVEFAKLFLILSRKQKKLLEDRLGLSIKDVRELFDLGNVDAFVALFDPQKVYYADNFEKERRRYKGIKGLKELGNSLPDDIVVRYHVTERAPRKSTAKEALHNVSYSSLIRYSTPINFLNKNASTREFGSGEFQQRNTIWQFEPTPEQARKVKRLARRWNVRVKESESIEEQIEVNNEFFSTLDEIMVSDQGVRVFRAFFRASGPIAFFFLPGVKQDFQLRESQLSALERQGKKSATLLLNKQKTDWCEMETRICKKVLTEEQIITLEELIGLPLSQTVSDRFDYQQRLKRNPLYRVSNVDSTGYLRVAFEDPRISYNLQTN